MARFSGFFNVFQCYYDLVHCIESFQQLIIPILRVQTNQTHNYSRINSELQIKTQEK